MRKVLIVLFLFFLLNPSFASFFKADNSVIISSSDNIMGNAYVAGNTVIINGVINGDLYAVGNIVEVNGLIKGDLVTGGNSISIKGNVTGDVRAASSVVTINGIVGGEVLTGASSLLLNEGSIVSEVNSGARDVLIAGIVNGNVTVNAENITIARTSVITGFLNYTSNNDALIPEASVISGFVQKNLPRLETDWSMRQKMIPFVSFAWSSMLINLFSTLLAGYVLVRLSTKLIKDYNEAMNKELVNKLIKGFAFIVLVPIAAIICLITIIAAPLSIVGLALYSIVLYVAGILSSFFVGRKVLEWLKASKQSLMTELLTGVIILEAINYVPIIGWLIKALIYLVSIGALLLVLSERMSECKSKKIF